MVLSIEAPTLVVQGMADHIVSPTSVEWLSTLRPDWDLALLEDTGHTPQMDAPRRFLRVVREWLEPAQRAVGA
jgi:pimeloyl-ACP methyl ester carboxylesterase